MNPENNYTINDALAIGDRFDVPTPQMVRLFLQLRLLQASEARLSSKPTPKNRK